MDIVVKSLDSFKCIYFTNRGTCKLTNPRIKCYDRIKLMYKQNNNHYTCIDFKDKSI